MAMVPRITRNGFIRNNDRRGQEMKIGTIWVVLAALVLPGLAAAPGRAGQDLPDCAAEDRAIRVIVKNVRRSKGTITVDLHGDNPKEFLKKGKKLMRVRVPAKRGSVAMCLPAPHAGVFAIGLYHDVNGNRKFDKNFLGLPKEPYGVSNNPRPRLGPPKHKDAAFAVGAEGATIEIVLRD
jgi:uncharacterized protein (DUF2141 family)